MSGLDKEVVARFTKAVCWLASRENTDAETRANAKAILDDLIYLRQMTISQPHGGACTNAETAEATDAPLRPEGKR